MRGTAIVLTFSRKMAPRKSKETAGKAVEASAITTNKSGHILLKIAAKPGAKKNNITDISEEGIGVQINAPPVDGEANTELVKYLALVMGLKKSEVTLDRGSKSRQKTVILSGGLTKETVLEKLNKEMSES